jgi:predicted glycoside hydrolase/deacetylase ChbG (UPF0249 family)
MSTPSATGKALLIVNADDLGYSRTSTDATLECLAEGRITSATAMVYMEDSDRASDAFRDAPIGIGLHLNLSEAFSAESVPRRVRDTQARLAELFRSDRRRQVRRWIYDPRIRADVERSIGNQLDRFQALYRRPPTHVDGHQHVQLSPNVFLAGALPAGTKMRRALDRSGSPRSMARLASSLRQRLISRRFACTEHFFDISEVDPSGDAEDADARLRLADFTSVEVMAHPRFDHEYARLMSDAWGTALRARRLGSYADLD